MNAVTSSKAPQTHSQPSRKGKKAWRKNVDLSEIQQGLDQAREEQLITGGKTLSELPADALFQTDITGSEATRVATRKKHGTLKADEIIAQRSAVPAVSLKKRKGETLAGSNKKQKDSSYVSHKELQRLKQVAWGGNSQHKDVVKADGEVSYDPWAATVEEANPQQSFLEKSKPTVEPVTLRRPGISSTVSTKNIPNVRRPEAGKSYNPEFNDWMATMDKAGNKEVEAERQRQANAAKEEDRLARVAKSAEEAEREAEKADLSEYESEWEGIQSDYEDAQLKKKRPERKTPVERNKIKRRKIATAQAKHEARMTAREEQAKQLAALKKEMIAKKDVKTMQKFSGDVESSDADEDDDEEEVLKKRNPWGRRSIPKAPLEIVLGDELEGTLRRLKPEGNPLLDRYRTAVLQGKVEPRKAASMRKQKLVKPTEKWAYKDWKLERKTL